MATFVDAWRSAVLADAALKSRAKLLACALAEFATYTTGEGVWPSGETLAAMTSSSPRTVTLARQDLLSRGWIEAEKRAGAHGTIRQKLVMRTGVDAQNSRNEDSDNRLTRMEDSNNRESRSAESAGVDAQKTTSRSAESAHKHRKNTVGEQEEEDAREVRACTEGVSEHGAMVDTSPSTCRDDVQETQPIREEVNQGDEVERKVRVQRIVWDILTDLALTDDLAADLGARSEQELKRMILPGMRVFARAVCLTDWSDGEVEHYVLERVNSFMHRDLAPGRWLSLMASREDMADYNATLMGGHNTAEPVIVMPDPPKQPGDDLPRNPSVRIASAPMAALMAEMQAEIDREAAERARREDERRERAQLEYERMRRELDKEVV